MKNARLQRALLNRDDHSSTFGTEDLGQCPYTCIERPLRTTVGQYEVADGFALEAQPALGNLYSQSRDNTEATVLSNSEGTEAVETGEVREDFTMTTK
jgi:hypothetical protein